MSEKEINTEEALENEEQKKDEKTELEMLNDKVAEAQELAAQTNDKYLRVMAEYDNFRKRTAKERDSLYSEAYADAVKGIIPIIDNIERARACITDEQTAHGIDMIITAAHEALTKMGVSEIEAKTFDPNMHNAVMHIDDESYGEGEIIEVFQKGYKYGEKIIRYAMVKVAN
ncbi:MAG: nucleotide exchange factor GrpE [Clostridia bacterium]|nr:nucleotide exchange factor GrpE [Clostridia bacterium]